MSFILPVAIPWVIGLLNGRELSISEEGCLVRATELTRKSAIVGEALERCIYCHGTKIRREGRRRKKHETVQLWYCSHCNRECDHVI